MKLGLNLGYILHAIWACNCVCVCVRACVRACVRVCVREIQSQLLAWFPVPAVFMLPSETVALVLFPHAVSVLTPVSGHV